MTLHLPERWIWDFWFAQDGPDYHIFYLQAPRALGDERRRHWHVSIGHAVSQDLRNWTLLPDALAPSAEDADAWDSYTTWTGSIIQHLSTWHLLYTGSKRTEKGLVQRIGLATSTDLIHWQKHLTNPLIVPDPQWYEVLDLEMWHDQAWRDPWLFRHDGLFHAYITARSNCGARLARGVIAHAQSADMLNWEVCAPVTAPGEFGYLEVPQLVQIEGRWYLVFSTTSNMHSEARRARPGAQIVTGTHYLVGDHPLGPFESLTDQFLLGDEIGSLFAGKILREPGGQWVLMATRAWAAGGGFVGEVGDPLPLQVHPDGRLAISDREGP